MLAAVDAVKAAVKGALDFAKKAIEALGTFAVIAKDIAKGPGRWISKLGLQLAWNLGLSAIPPEIAPYVTGECIMNTERLRTFLGHDYEDVIRYTIQDAFVESLAGIVPSAAVEQSVGK